MFSPNALLLAALLVAAPAAVVAQGQPEAAKKLAEIEAQNKKIEADNATVARTFAAGDKALRAKRYDEAIALYDEGLAAREEPALLTYKSVALRARGAARFNASLRNTDAAAKTAAQQLAAKDWREAAAAAARAAEVIKSSPPAADPAAQASQRRTHLSALNARAEAMRLVATKVDKSRMREAVLVFRELLAAEIDPARRAAAQSSLARMMFDAEDFQSAAVEWRKVLATAPEDADASAYLGLSLFGTGDRTKFAEAAKVLERFVATAPDAHPLKAGAKDALDFLNQQNKR